MVFAALLYHYERQRVDLLHRLLAGGNFPMVARAVSSERGRGGHIENEAPPVHYHLHRAGRWVPSRSQISGTVGQGWRGLMSQTSFIAGVIFLMFIVFVTVRGELPNYLNIVGL